MAKLYTFKICEGVEETGNKKVVQILEVTEDTVPLPRKLRNNIKTVSITTSSIELKKKEITWDDATYLDKVHLQDLRVRSASTMLERKASVGPCYRKTPPFGEPSGITINCLPKRSFKSLSENLKTTRSGICITVSKKCFDNNRPRSSTDYEVNSSVHIAMKEKKAELKIEDDHYEDFCANLKGKLDNLCLKIRHIIHM